MSIDSDVVLSTIDELDGIEFCAFLSPEDIHGIRRVEEQALANNPSYRNPGIEEVLSYRGDGLVGVLAKNARFRPPGGIVHVHAIKGIESENHKENLHAYGESYWVIDPDPGRTPKEQVMERTRRVRRELRRRGISRTAERSDLYLGTGFSELEGVDGITQTHLAQPSANAHRYLEQKYEGIPRKTAVSTLLFGCK